MDPLSGTYELDFLRNLNTAYRLLTNYATRRIKHLGLTLAQALMLHFLSHCTDDSLENIAKELHMAKSAARQTLHQLLDAGYLVRLPDAHDHRRHHFVLQEKSSHLLPSLVKLGDNIVHQSLSSLTEYERITLSGLLEKMKQNILGQFGELTQP